MSEGFLLDTNVISEVVRSEPHPRVIAFLEEETELWMSTIALHELEFGVRRLAPGRRRDRLHRAVSRALAQYRDRLLPPGRLEAVEAAILRARAAQEGRVLKLADALIAGTARTNGLAVATRNTRNFDSLDIVVVNPWEGA